MFFCQIVSKMYWLSLIFPLELISFRTVGKSMLMICFLRCHDFRRLINTFSFTMHKAVYWRKLLTIVEIDENTMPKR